LIARAVHARSRQQRRRVCAHAALFITRFAQHSAARTAAFAASRTHTLQRGACHHACCRCAYRALRATPLLALAYNAGTRVAISRNAAARCAARITRRISVMAALG